jgi:glycine/D-amino acid oxidase-like deaminating enzyme
MPQWGQSPWVSGKAQTKGKTQTKAGAAPLSGDKTVDAVVIGAGLTGCAAAFAMAEAGLKVVVLDEGEIAGGSTRAAMGLVLPMPAILYGPTAKDAGARATKAAFSAWPAGAKGLAAAIRRASKSAGVQAIDLVVNAPFTNDAAVLKKDLDIRPSAQAAWMTQSAAREALATETQGAARFKGAYQIDPVEAAHVLAAAAKKKGARFYERTRVMKTTFTRKDATVVTKNAKLTTTRIVVATGRPGAVFKQLERHVRVTQGYVVMTEPLTPAMRTHVGTRKALYTEGTESPRWLRWIPGQRAMFGGIAAPEPAPALRKQAIVQRANQLMYELSLRYPEISGLPPAAGWDVPIVSTADGLPWIGAHRNYPFHFFAMATGWHGEAAAWVAAEAAVRYFQGSPRREDAQLGFARAL